MNISATNFLHNDGKIIGDNIFSTSASQLILDDYNLITVPPQYFNVTQILGRVSFGKKFEIHGFLIDMLNRTMSNRIFTNLNIRLTGKDLLDSTQILVTHSANLIRFQNIIIRSAINRTEPLYVEIMDPTNPILGNFIIVQKIDLTVLVDCAFFERENDLGYCDLNSSLLYLLFLLFIPIILIILICIGTIVIGYYYHKRKVEVSVQRKLDSMLFDERNSLSTRSSMSEITELDFSLPNDIFKINFEDITNLSTLGSGGSGALLIQALWRNQPVALKLFNTNDFDETKSHQEFEHELRLLFSLNHANIVSCYGACLKRPRIGIVMEFCDQGSLRQWLKRNKGKVTWGKKISILLGIAHGMTFLHSKNIIHRDLKSK